MASEAQTTPIRVLLNPNASKSDQMVLSQSLAGKHVIEPAVQKRGSHFAIDARLFLADRYGEFPSDVKDAARAAIAKATAA